jgi:predicted kinase
MSDYNIIVVVCGLPGSGKSYFAEALAQRISAVYLNSDRIRREISRQGMYSFSDKLITYRLMSERALESVNAHRDVVVDGTFYAKAMVDIFAKMAKDFRKVYFIKVVADEGLIKSRLDKPRNDSEADFDVYLKIKEQFQDLEVSHLTLRSTNDNLEEMIIKGLDFLKIKNGRNSSQRTG